MLEKRLEKKLEKNREVFWHFLALFVVIVWGTTLASTKVLLADKAALATLVDVAEEEHDKGVSFGVVIGRALRAIGEGEA